MKYYTSGDKLIQHNESTGVYRVRNTIERGNNILSQEQFDALQTIRIKKTKFCELANKYFSSVKHEWEWNGQKFRKLENFGKNANSPDVNWVDVPSHEVDGYMFSRLRFVYHWGRVYYILYGGNYAPKGQLVDTKTLKILQWVDIKNVAPVFNVTTKKII